IEPNSPPFQRFLPTGNNPEIALDTQTGSLCRTVDDVNDPLGLRDPDCAVNEQEKKLGFVPKACTTRKTWLSGSGDVHRDRYASLPRCGRTKGRSFEDLLEKEKRGNPDQ